MVTESSVSQANQNLRTLRKALLESRTVTADFFLDLLNNVISITNLDGQSDVDLSDDNDAVTMLSGMKSLTDSTPAKQLPASGCTHSNISVYNVCRLCGQDLNVKQEPSAAPAEIKTDV